MTSPGVEKGESYSIQQASVRLDLRNPDAGKESEEANIPLGGGLHWVFPDDEWIPHVREYRGPQGTCEEEL